MCQGPAIIDIRRHNANFCADHFLELCRRQVTKAIDEFAMIEPGERVLVAVSGGKDSLAVWDILLDLGYEADGLYVGPRHRRLQRRLGHLRPRLRRRAWRSRCSRSTCPATTATTSRPAHGPPGGRRARPAGSPSATCSTQAALDGGYDVVVTGHNLDDEAAVLFGNVLHWHTEYLGRQLPVLPARDGFPRKVKPLVRLGEREMAAYCVVRGIDYLVEECPMAAGNKHLGYKEALNDIEAESPGAKHAFYFGFLDRAAAHFAPEAEADRAELGACRILRRARPRRGVRVLPAGRARRGTLPEQGVDRGRRSSSARRACAATPTTVEPRRGRPDEPSVRRRRPGAADRPQEAAVPRHPQGGRRVPLPRRVRPPRRLIGAPEGITVRSTRNSPLPRACARRCRTSCSRCPVARR